MRKVDRILSLSIFRVITLGLAMGWSNPFLGSGAIGLVGLPGLINNVL
jgi:hypothetical protein